MSKKDDEILNWIIAKMEKFTKYGETLPLVLKKRNDLRIEHWGELAESRIKELKDELVHGKDDEGMR